MQTPSRAENDASLNEDDRSFGRLEKQRTKATKRFGEGGCGTQAATAGARARALAPGLPDTHGSRLDHHPGAASLPSPSHAQAAARSLASSLSEATTAVEAATTRSA